MRIQLHGLPHNVSRLGPRSPQQLHLVHGVQQLAMGRLKAVNLWDGPGHNDRHGIGHVIDLQRLGDGLFQHFRPQAHYIWVNFSGFLFI